MNFSGPGFHPVEVVGAWDGVVIGFVAKSAADGAIAVTNGAVIAW